MNLENKIKDVIKEKLEDGSIEKLVAEQLEVGVKHALKDLFGSYGDVTKVIEKQIKSVMVPYLENYNYEKYILKLDSVLVDVLQHSALENKKMLENFKDLMIPEDIKKIKVTEIFESWMKFVEKNVETDGLDICYDDEPTYENVDVSFEVEYTKDKSSWSRSTYESAVITFACDHDEEMNIEIPIHRWTDINEDEWTIDFKSVKDLSSLRNLNSFEVFLMKLNQNYTRLIIDSEGDSNEVEPEKRPEAEFS